MILCKEGSTEQMRKNLFWLNDDEGQKIERLLPVDVRGKDRVDEQPCYQRDPSCVEKRLPVVRLSAGIRLPPTTNRCAFGNTRQAGRIPTFLRFFVV